MSDNKCASCGQFAGRGHRCPTAEAWSQMDAYRKAKPSNATFVQPQPDLQEDVEERVQRAQAALLAAEEHTVFRYQTHPDDYITDARTEGTNDRVYTEDPDSAGPVRVTYRSGVTEVMSMPRYKEAVASAQRWQDMPESERAEIRNRQARIDRDRGEQFALRNADGNLHAEDGPAMRDRFGNLHYYVMGKCHRVDGPAIIHADGSEEWYVNGVAHRLDGPAVTNADGTTEWFKEGRRHREDGPAVERPDGSKEYWQNGEWHNERGYAVVRADGSGEFYLQGRRVNGLPYNEMAINAFDRLADRWDGWQADRRRRKDNR